MTDAQIADSTRKNGVEHLTSEGDPNEGYSWDLTPSTSYTICMVAYDAAGNAGPLTKASIATKSASSSQPLATVNVTNVSGGTRWPLS